MNRPATREQRLAEANKMLRVIASCGRRFFSYHDKVSYLELDARGRVWFIDSYTSERIYTHHKGRWRGFTQGGTMKNLVSAMRDYVTKGQLLPAGTFGPWPSWICNSEDLWGYGQDMDVVRAAATGLVER